MSKSKKNKAQKNILQPAVAPAVLAPLSYANDPVVQRLLAQQAEMLKAAHQQELRALEAQRVNDLARIDIQHRADLYTSLQLCEDACLIATADVRGIGPANAVLLRDKFRRTVNEISCMLVEDSRDDDDTTWSRAKWDERLAQIEGPENAKDWDTRFAWAAKVLK